MKEDMLAKKHVLTILTKHHDPGRAPVEEKPIMQSSDSWLEQFAMSIISFMGS